MSYPGVWSLAWSLRTTGLTCSVSMNGGEPRRQELAAEGPGHTMQWADSGIGQGLTTEAGKAWAMVLTLRDQGPE